jgi:HPt (histidine-containing phosphotransfer) domain-containing protein
MQPDRKTRGARERPADLEAAMARFWRENLPDHIVRVKALEDAIAALGADRLSPTVRAEALAAAHTLRGSAPIFGFARAGEIASQLEDALAGETSLAKRRVPELKRLVLELRADLEAAPGVDGAQ